MPPTSFDISSLIDFAPPHYFCQKCYALLRHGQLAYKSPLPKIDGTDEYLSRCPVCRVVYTPSAYETWQAFQYLQDTGLGIKYDNLLDHSQVLAQVAVKARSFYDEKTPPRNKLLPMQALLQSLSVARYFVHFTSYGISPLLIGALKLTAQRISVRGIVSGVDTGIRDEIINYADEAPRMKVHIFERSKYTGGMDFTPHQKLIVIDGLLAFTGSANMTISGWRKAAQNRDHVEVVTETSRVIELHNRYFSPIWAEFSTYGEEIEMDVPF
jgi:phosphatidylserine/phosphatidylglycerophosphate/cardiolipin synthase-like enzyme